MKKITLILIFAFSIVTISYSQDCLPGYYNINSQQQIDDFATDYPGCVNILGNLMIDNSYNTDITNLDGLSQLETIGGNLNIRKNSGLTSITGLSNIISVGADLLIHNLNILTTFDGLDNINTIGGRLYINNNSSLTNINALGNLTSIGDYVFFGSNPDLVSLEGFEGIQSIPERIEIYNCGSLTNLTGLENLTSIANYLYLRNNNALINLLGLENLTSIGGRIVVRDNAVLTSLSGIQNIDPSTIEANNTYDEDLEIFNNPMLSECEVQSICDVVNDPNKTTDIHDNMTGCDTESEVEAACSAIPIEMLYFNANKTKGIINLTWSTASETNNEGWNIQRSNNGHTFETIAWIEGGGNNRDINEYQYNDTKPNKGLNVYRLEQVDFDGITSYSKYKSIYIEATTKRLFPNPTNNEIFLDGYKNGQIKIKTINGTIVLETVIYKNQPINVSKLKQGIYNLQLIEDGKVENFRFIVGK